MKNNKLQQVNFNNTKRDNKNEKSVVILIDDSSDHIDNQKKPSINLIENKHEQDNCIEFNNKQDQVQQKPIKLRTYEQRLNLIQFQSKPSKRIKLLQQSAQKAIIIRFAQVKNGIEPAEQDQNTEKLEKAKQKKAVPWMTKPTREIEDVCLRFHNEAVEFFEYIRPSKKEHETRLKIFNMVKQMILQKYPEAKVQYFGSFSTKLYLPDGDIDITVLIDGIEEYEQRKVYDSINKIIRRSEGTIFCDVQYIRNSKVPLIKFLHIETQIPFDISVNKRDGINQVQHVQRMKKLYPEFEPLVFILKTMLKVRNMSETYTGGVGSFLLFCMILHFLRYVHKKQCYYTLGEYVMKFMQFYGISGDWQRKSVYVADSTEVPRAREPGTLSFFSPQDDSHDIGKSAFKTRDVFNIFKNRFRVISGKNFKQGESILKELINPALEEFRYYRYEKLMNKKID